MPPHLIGPSDRHRRQIPMIPCLIGDETGSHRKSARRIAVSDCGKGFPVCGNRARVSPDLLSVAGNGVSVSGNAIRVFRKDFSVSGKVVPASGKQVSVSGNCLSVSGNDVSGELFDDSLGIFGIFLVFL